MASDPINWNEVPEEITKEQLWRLCHISKSTARFLLQSGKIPCRYSGKKTRCYRILKSDVLAYLRDRELYPEFYRASGERCTANGACKNRTPVIKEDLHEYYEYLLKDMPDVLSGSSVSEVCGYSRAAVNRWCLKGLLKHLRIKGQNMMGLQFLSLLLHKHWGQEAVIIIDKYDTPIQQGHSCGFYAEIVNFMRNFFSGGLKDKNCTEPQLETLAKTALRQINNRKYDIDLQTMSLTSMIKIGIAFSGKKARIAVER